jgi:hypothetical protein
MTTAKDYKPGDQIAWIDIITAGLEKPRRGEVWAPAPALPGIGRAYWVLPNTMSNGKPVLVAVATSRHRCGRGSMKKWIHKGGRWIDAGENYREPMNDGAIVNEIRLGRLHRPPTHVQPSGRPDPNEVVDTEAFYRYCEGRARGE